jgi:dipeptidase
MKKTKLFAALLAGTVATTAFGPENAEACTNILVTRGASKTGSTMISYSADSHTLYGELYYRPAADYPAGTMMKVYEWDTGRFMGEIPQAEHTYSVVGNMNEHQLLIGESTWGGLHQLVDTTGIIDYGSLMYIALQRCRTAREAVEFMTKLVAEYGYASSGESISVADPNEVWVLEIIGKGTKIVDGKNVNKGAVWVARRIPDGMISAHANQARITTFPLNDPENCIYSPDVISFAREAGLYTGKDKDFDFAAIYNPFDYSGMRGCEGRVWSVFRQVTGGMDKYLDHVTGRNPKNRLPLWVKPDRKLTVKEVAEFMRNHYEGTELDMTCDPGAGPFKLPYRWRPMTFKVGDEEFFNERAIATQQTGWWYVGECRGWLPDPIGGVLWFGVDDADSSPLTPFYCGIDRIPNAYAVGNGNMTTYSETSMFWAVNRVTNFAYGRYNIIHPDVKRAMDRFENRCFAEQPAVDGAAEMLYRQDPKLAVDFLTDYSVNTAQRLFDTWVALDRYLLVKYIDGNVKKEDAEGVFTDNGQGRGIPAMPDFPGYDDEWKRIVKEAAGDRLRVVETK